MIAELSYYLIVSAVLFTIGVVGVLVRKNPLVIFMAIELMFNAANLTFVAFSRYLNLLDGQVLALLVMTIAAAEVVVGLAIIVAIFRSRASIDVDEVSALHG